MDLRGRVGRLARAVTARTPDRRFWSVTVCSAADDPEGRSPGMYGSSQHLDVVYDGPEPPPLPRERLAPHCVIIECGLIHDPADGVYSVLGRIPDPAEDWL